MKKSKYGPAIKFIVESIVDVLRHSDDLDNHPLYQSYIDYTTPMQFLGLPLETWFFIILIIFAISYLGYKFYTERDYRRCERQLAALHAAKQAKKFNQSSCPICLQDFPSNSNSNSNSGDNSRATAILICGHKFCKQCLDSWFNSQSASNQKCPICRHDRDDWSAVRGSQSQSQQNDNEQEQKMDDDEKKQDNDEDETKYDGAASSSGGYSKTSTSDSFYQNDDYASFSQQNMNHNGSSTFRRRRYGGRNMDDWMFQQELLFRMRRIRYMYPRYVSDDMVSRWSRPDYTGSFVEIHHLLG